MASSINLTNQASRRGRANLIASIARLSPRNVKLIEVGRARAVLGAKTKPAFLEVPWGHLLLRAHTCSDTRPHKGPRCHFSTAFLLRTNEG